MEKCNACGALDVVFMPGSAGQKICGSCYQELVIKPAAQLVERKIRELSEAQEGMRRVLAPLASARIEGSGLITCGCGKKFGSGLDYMRHHETCKEPITKAHTAAPRAKGSKTSSGDDVLDF